jgi:hypothetical protein
LRRNLVGAAWTNLGLTAGDLTRTQTWMTSLAGPVTVTAIAFDERTAGGQGTVQLVAPALVKIFGGLYGEQPVIGMLRLEYEPEPGTLLLVGSGVVAFAAIGRRRARRAA